MLDSLYKSLRPLQHERGLDAVNFSDQCKVCNSPHRAEIEKLILEGWSVRRIANWLKETYGEQISHAAIANHKNKHFNVAREIRKRVSVEESKQLFETAVREGISRIDSLKQERLKNIELAEMLRSIFKQLLVNNNWKTVSPETIKALQMLYHTATTQVRLTAAEEYKQLGGTDVEDVVGELLRQLAGIEEDEEDRGGSEEASET